MKLPKMTLTIWLCLLAGCVQYQDRRGVEVTWQDTVTTQLVRGSSSREQVLSILGPPSQVISLEDESVLYYLFEHSKGTGMILILYNRMEIDTRYERAIFFFDEQDILTDYSTHIYVPEQG